MAPIGMANNAITGVADLHIDVIPQGLRISSHGISGILTLAFIRDGRWMPLPCSIEGHCVTAQVDGTRVSMTLRDCEPGIVAYELSLEAGIPTRVAIGLSMPGRQNYFHLIPACMFGDNNHAMAKPNEFPTLSAEICDDRAASSRWDFRADRAAMPVSMLCFDGGVAAVSICPYSDHQTHPEGFARNGVFSELPDRCGVTVGYGNFPLTFINKRNFGPPTEQLLSVAKVSGCIFLLSGSSRGIVHTVIRRLYRVLRHRPAFTRSPEIAMRGLAEAFATVNWQSAFQNYCNLKCAVPLDTALKPWRPLSEIGWTGGSVLAYPMLVTEKLLPEIKFPKRPTAILNDICAVYNSVSGLFSDVSGPALVNLPNGARIVSEGVNSWWSGFIPATMDRHCAYTNGQAAYYLLKSVHHALQADGAIQRRWVQAACRVLDTAVDLQRPDGAFGYLFSVTERKVVDWDGFAGCWFAAALVLAWKLTGKERYFTAATRGLAFYKPFVHALNCWGTPMDTWRSVDQEGVLAYIQACRYLFEFTGKDEYLEMLAAGAEYEFLWRYGYAVRPEFRPLAGSNWNSCGGSVTSASNPHIHPMGLVIGEPLEILAERIGDSYYKHRADDGLAWALNSLELYPEVMGYGRYGVISERFCPSDGFNEERYADSGTPASTWWSYNGWAAAATLEGVAESVFFDRRMAVDMHG